MSRKRIIGVIGDANLKGDEIKGEISFQIGKMLIDNDFILATGGLGGVMECASKGAKSSSNYHDGMIIGVTPDYIDSDYNEYLDIVIPTGMGLARNVILTSMCDGVVAIGGKAGTMSEIALAWQMGKMVIALDVNGCSGDYKATYIDKRRDDIIFPARTAEEAIDLIIENIENYPFKYSGIRKGRIGKTGAISLIKKKYDIQGELKFLGKGSEGYVFHDLISVYKIIDNDHPLLNQYWRLKSLSEDIKNSRTEYLFSFDVDLEEKAILIRYDHFHTKSYKGRYQRQLRYLAKELKRIGWLITDFQPKNIRIRSKDEKPVIVDIGHSFEPYHEELFRKMCRRMFVSSLIGDRNDIKPYLSETNESEDFIGMKDHGFDPKILKSDFQIFYEKVAGTDKKDILNPLIKSLINGLDDVHTIFDYGSGYGDLSRSLNDEGYDVTSYDIDYSLFDKYKEKYYKNIPFLKQIEMKKLVTDEEKFDVVLLSLLLCHPLSDKKIKRNEIINEILNDIKTLSKKFIIIAICNPLYSNRYESHLQYRVIDKDFMYSKENRIIKKVKSSCGEREDFHRPISFYINLFEKHGLNLLRIDQTPGFDPQEKEVIQSDFMTFLLEVK